MYKNRKFKSNKTKASLNPIGEDTTIKIPKYDKENETTAKGDDEKELFSQETIPASQEPTQRYLSQRSTLCRTQSRSTQRAPTTYFELVLIKSGVDLDQPDNFIISCDHVSFVCKFRDIFVKCQNYPSNVETFKTSLRDALNDKNLSMKLLSGCTISLPGEENPYQSQDSMIVNFLMVDFLQDVVINVVLDKIEECSKDGESRSNAVVPILPLLLSQLRYVTHSHADLIYSRIVEIFENAVRPVQWDIIAHAEMFLHASKHDTFAEMLLNNFASNEDVFHSTTIRSFTNLCLSSGMQTRLRKKAVAYIKKGCPPKILPLLIRLSLKILNDDNDDVTTELISDLRDILVWDKGVQNDPEVKQSQIDTFNFIVQGLTRSKKLFDTWQKAIMRLAPINFKALDFIILLCMISVKEERSYYIQNLIRNRIKLEHITVDVLSEMREKYPFVLLTQLNGLLQILHDFLKEKNKLISDFARNSYNIIFGIGQSTQKDILLKLVDLTCDKSSSNMTTTALELIKDLRAKYPPSVQNWGTALMPLLDRIHDMTLSQTRLVMELLCSIAFPPPPLEECPVLQDQIDMLVKKQIINRLPIIKKQGIIGVVQMINNVARIEQTISEAMYDLNESYNTVEELPEGRGKIAANYVARIHSTTMYCPESLALFYDELAIVCCTHSKIQINAAYLDRPFVIWLCELITYYFQNSFVIEDQPRSDLGVPLSYQKCINSTDDINSPNESELIPIAVNISQLVLCPSAEASLSITVLAPLFNLMRVLHFIRYDGSLEMINALLGCGIILPVVFDEVDNVDIFYEYSEEQCKQILDIFYHSVNWIRESVSSFSSQDDHMIRGKVLTRLSELIKIETNIRKLLIKAPSDYNPPMCQFMVMPTTPGHNKKPAGRKKSASKAADRKKCTSVVEHTEQDVSLGNVSVTNATKAGNLKAQKENIGKFNTNYGPKEMYRQLSPDIMLLLKVPFNPSYPRQENDTSNSIGLLEFKFLMTDIVNKLESVTGVQKFIADQQLQYIVYPNYFINDIVMQFLDPIVTIFQQISGLIATAVEKVEGALGNADLFTDELNYLKVCFALCLRLLAALFSWSGFGDASNKKLLKEALLAIIGRSVRQQFVNKDVQTLSIEAFTKVRNFEACTIDIQSAVHLYHLMQSLRKFAPKKDLNTEICNICKILLCRKWFSYDGTMERGSLCNTYLDELVKGYLKKSDFRRQKLILRTILDETQYLKSKESSLRSFPNFNKANFPMLFRGLCETLTNSLSDTVRNGGQSGESDQLKVWEKSCEILNTLLGIVQSLDVPRNFILFLKHAHIYLKIVLQHGLPVYENFLRDSPERVNELLKSLQVTTRFLHNLCCHSKALKNTPIVSHIPPLRETVENLVFRVKALLAANKCASVFWMGNLKNKDLHGDEILSQTASWASANDVNSDEDIPEDDVSVDETVLGDNDNGRTSVVNDSSRSTCI